MVVLSYVPAIHALQVVLRLCAHDHLAFYRQDVDSADGAYSKFLVSVDPADTPNTTDFLAHKSKLYSDLTTVEDK